MSAVRKRYPWSLSANQVAATPALPCPPEPRTGCRHKHVGIHETTEASPQRIFTDIAIATRTCDFKLAQSR